MSQILPAKYVDFKLFPKSRQRCRRSNAFGQAVLHLLTGHSKTTMSSHSLWHGHCRANSLGGEGMRNLCRVHVGAPPIVDRCFARNGLMWQTTLFVDGDTKTNVMFIGIGTLCYSLIFHTTVSHALRQSIYWWSRRGTVPRLRWLVWRKIWCIEAVPVYSSVVVVLDTGRQIKEVMSMHEMQIGGYCIYFPPEGLIRCDTYFAKVA